MNELQNTELKRTNKEFKKNPLFQHPEIITVYILEHFLRVFFVNYVLTAGSLQIVVLPLCFA